MRLCRCLLIPTALAAPPVIAQSASTQPVSVQPVSPQTAAPQTTPADPVRVLIEETRTTLEGRIQAYRAHVAAGKPRSEFHWGFGAELGRINDRLSRPQPEELKQALLVAEMGYRVVGRQKPDSPYFESIRAAVPATSRAWAIDPSLLAELAENLENEKAAASYLAQARAHSPVHEVRASLLILQFEEALESKDEATWRGALAMLETQHGDSKELAQARRNLEEYRKTAVGTPAPPFSLPSLESPATVYNLETFKGKWVLIDFWATWCSYCRLELPFLHKAWERHQDRLEILSLSFDQRPADIAPFRRQPGTPMPWKHAFVEGAKKSPVAQAYGVTGIPKILLLDPTGKIAATDGDLKGKRLEKTLEKFLGR